MAFAMLSCSLECVRVGCPQRPLCCQVRVSLGAEGRHGRRGLRLRFATLDACPAKQGLPWDYITLHYIAFTLHLMLMLM